MIRFEFEDRTVEAPTEWSEVTVADFCKKEFFSGNSLQLIASISGIPVRQLASTTEDVMAKFEKVTAFIRNDASGWKGGQIKPIVIDEVTCTIPKNIELEMFGQKVMLGDVLGRIAFIYEGIPDVVAIYLAPQIYPEDWFNRIEEVKDKIYQLPITQVYPIANFFLTLSNSSPKDGKES